MARYGTKEPGPSGKSATVTARKRKNWPPGFAQKTDRRVLRTRSTLGEALVSLIHEKDFDEITVQEVLDHAGVGRSTFYAHYSDKDDLFLSDVEEFLERCSSGLKRQGADPKRLLPVREFFEHIREMREFYAALVRSGKMNDIQALARGVFARSIEERLKAAGIEMETAGRSAHAHALAGSFFSLLDWWVDKGMKTEPAAMDEIFHRIAWKGLSES
jgi:AcrR family transcriptional regulator